MLGRWVFCDSHLASHSPEQDYVGWGLYQMAVVSPLQPTSPQTLHHQMSHTLSNVITPHLILTACPSPRYILTTTPKHTYCMYSTYNGTTTIQYTVAYLTSQHLTNFLSFFYQGPSIFIVLWQFFKVFMYCQAWYRRLTADSYQLKFVTVICDVC